MEIPILYEDDNIVVINKPAGLVVHSDGKTVEPSVADWVLEKYPEAADVGEAITLSNGGIIKRPGIVHRIDRETSGVLIIAKTKEAHAFLKAQFQDHKIKKTYNAFVYGVIKDEDGTIDRPIGRSKSDFRKWSAQRGTRGEMREAVTNYKVLNRGKDFSFVEVEPKTGRTHQIRVHFKAINHPLVCDKLYASSQPSLLGFERLALHAKSVEFENLAGKKIKVEAPYPADFENALKKIN
ncbi:MAG: RluA family pseudouridine synthase [Candidatus Paceibacterota bacterium]